MKRSREDVPRESLTRKKSINRSQWKCVIAKTAKDLGKECTNQNGKLIPARKMLQGCRENCRFECRKKIPEDECQTLFKTFWSIGDHQRQWDFIGLHTVRCSKDDSDNKEETEKERRTSRKYFFRVK